MLVPLPNEYDHIVLAMTKKLYRSPSKMMHHYDAAHDARRVGWVASTFHTSDRKSIPTTVHDLYDLPGRANTFLI